MNSSMPLKTSGLNPATVSVPELAPVRCQIAAAMMSSSIASPRAPRQRDQAVDVFIDAVAARRPGNLDVEDGVVVVVEDPEGDPPGVTVFGGQGAAPRRSAPRLLPSPRARLPAGKADALAGREGLGHHGQPGVVIQADHVAHLVDENGEQVDPPAASLSAPAITRPSPRAMPNSEDSPGVGSTNQPKPSALASIEIPLPSAWPRIPLGRSAMRASRWRGGRLEPE